MPSINISETGLPFALSMDRQGHLLSAIQHVEEPTRLCITLWIDPGRSSGFDDAATQKIAVCSVLIWHKLSYTGSFSWQMRSREVAITRHLSSAYLTVL